MVKLLKRPRRDSTQSTPSKVIKVEDSLKLTLPDLSDIPGDIILEIMKFIDVMTVVRNFMICCRYFYYKLEWLHLPNFKAHTFRWNRRETPKVNRCTGAITNPNAANDLFSMNLTYVTRLKRIGTDSFVDEYDIFSLPLNIKHLEIDIHPDLHSAEWLRGLHNLHMPTMSLSLFCMPMSDVVDQDRGTAVIKSMYDIPFDKGIGKRIEKLKLIMDKWRGIPYYNETQPTEPFSNMKDIKSLEIIPTSYVSRRDFDGLSITQSEPFLKNLVHLIIPGDIEFYESPSDANSMTFFRFPYECLTGLVELKCDLSMFSHASIHRGLVQLVNLQHCCVGIKSCSDEDDDWNGEMTRHDVCNDSSESEDDPMNVILDLIVNSSYSTLKKACVVDLSGSKVEYVHEDWDSVRDPPFLIRWDDIDYPKKKRDDYDDGSSSSDEDDS